TNAKAAIDVIDCLNNRAFWPYVWKRSKARSSSFYGITNIDIPAVTNEKIEPAVSSVRLGFPCGPGHAATVPKNQRTFAIGMRWQEILHIHLFDNVGTVGIDADRFTSVAHRALVARFS